MDNIYLKTGFDLIHIITTILWFGSMFTINALVKPALETTVDKNVQQQIMIKLMKKIKIVIYVCFALLFITGIPMKIANENYVSIINFSNNWQILSFIKHVFVAILGLLVLYNFELHPRLLKKAITTDNNSEISKLTNIFTGTGKLSMALAFIILVLSAFMRYM